MGNKPVYVRPLAAEEGQRLQRLLRRGRDPVARRRAEIILCSAQGDTAGEIARRLHFTPWYVRQVIHGFNDRGLASLAAQYRKGGRPRAMEPEHESELVELALTPPRLTGQPFTHWSMKTLREVAMRRKLIPEVSKDTVRRVLKKHRLSLQRTKTWKQSTDPLFEEKKTRLRHSIRRPKQVRRR